MIPVFLESEGEEYFPTFSSGEEIPENDESTAILSMHFLEVVEVAAKTNGGCGHQRGTQSVYRSVCS